MNTEHYCRRHSGGYYNVFNGGLGKLYDEDTDSGEYNLGLCFRLRFTGVLTKVKELIAQLTKGVNQEIVMNNVDKEAKENLINYLHQLKLNFEECPIPEEDGTKVITVDVGNSPNRAEAMNDLMVFVENEKLKMARRMFLEVENEDEVVEEEEEKEKVEDEEECRTEPSTETSMRVWSPASVEEDSTVQATEEESTHGHLTDQEVYTEREEEEIEESFVEKEIKCHCNSIKKIYEVESRRVVPFPKQASVLLRFEEPKSVPSSKWDSSPDPKNFLEKEFSKSQMSRPSDKLPLLFVKGDCRYTSNFLPTKTSTREIKKKHRVGNFFRNMLKRKKPEENKNEINGRLFKKKRKKALHSRSVQVSVIPDTFNKSPWITALTKEELNLRTALVQGPSLRPTEEELAKLGERLRDRRPTSEENSFLDPSTGRTSSRITSTKEVSDSSAGPSPNVYQSRTLWCNKSFLLTN